MKSRSKQKKYLNFTALKKEKVDLRSSALNFALPKKGDVPLSKEEENVIFRIHPAITYKIGEYIVNISQKKEGDIITYYVILPKKENAFSRYSWKGILRQWNLIPLFG